MSDEFQAPADIWLQGHMHPETTWCVDQIEPTDVRYVRADRIEALEAALRECLEDLEALEANLDRCGDADAECPLQDWGATHCVGHKSLPMARAALAAVKDTSDV